MSSFLCAFAVPFLVAALTGCTPKILSGSLNNPSSPTSSNSSGSSVIAQPSVLLADGSSSSTVTVTLRDKSGNSLIGRSIVLISDRGSFDIVTDNSGPSDINGQVSFQVNSTHSGTSVFSATNVSDHAFVSSSASITFLPGSYIPSQSTVVSAQPSVVADGISNASLIVTLLDAQGNPASGQPVTLVSSRGGSDLVHPPSGLTDGLGKVVFTANSTTVGTASFTASVSGNALPQTSSVTFVAGPGSSSRSTLVANPLSVVADGVATSIVTVTLLDSLGNPVVGKTVSLASNRGASDTISSASGPSSSSGVVTFTVKSSNVGTPVFTATDVTDSAIVGQTSTISFVAATASDSQSTLSATPLLIPADGSTSATVTVTLKESSGSPSVGKTVTLSSSRGGNDSISAASGLSNASGIVTFTVQSAYVGSAILTASDTTDSLTLTQTATVHFYGNLASSSSVMATPASIPADHSTISTITVTLRDSTSTPIPGKTITLSSSRGSLDTLATLSGTTNASGQATFTLLSSKIGMPILTATDHSDSVTINQTFQLHVLAAGSTPQTDYRSALANQGYLPGNNNLPVSSFKNVETSSSANSGTLYGFGYTTSSGWSGDGSLLTSGVLGPNRLVFDGTSNYLDFGSSFNSNSSFTIETWIRSQNPSALGSVIFSNVNSSNVGVTLAQSSTNAGKVNFILNASNQPGSTFAQQVLADSPYIYWHLNESSGSTIIDYSGNGNDGTYGTYNALSGSIAYGQPSLNLDGLTSVQFTPNAMGYSNASFNNPYPVTIELWFKTTTTDGGVMMGLANNQTSNISAYDRQVVMRTDGSIYFEAWGNPIYSASSGYNDGMIHHLVATISPAGNYLYIDGILAASNPLFTGVQNMNGYWQVSGGVNYWSGINSMIFEGTLSDVAVYNIALSQSRIQAHYATGRARICQSISVLPANAWNSLAGTFDSTTGLFNFYINGNQECSGTYPGISVSGSAAHLDFGSDTFQSNFWSGSFGALKAYSTALTNTAVQSNYAAIAAQFDQSKLGAPIPILWYRADAIEGLSDGATVATWPDSSANGNNANQGTAANQPIWKKNSLNGYPVVRFNGTTSFFSAPSVFPTHSDYTAIAVVNAFSETLDNGILASYGHGFYINGTIPKIYHNPYGSAPDSTYPVVSNTPFLFSAVYVESGRAVNIYTNGAQTASASVGGSVSDSGVIIGSFGGYNYFYGDIAEIFLFGQALSNNDRSLIETYLNAKYALF